MESASVYSMYKDNDWNTWVWTSAWVSRFIQ
jgi:hypothetical protein